MSIYAQIPAVPSKRPSENIQRTSLLLGRLYYERSWSRALGYWHFCFSVIFLFFLLTVERRRWKRVCAARLSGGAGAAAGCGVTAPGRGGGGAPRREVGCDGRSELPAAARCGRPGRDRGSPAFPGKGCSERAAPRGRARRVPRGAAQL